MSNNLQWWEMNEAALAANPGAQHERQVAYKATFYGSSHGRDVLFDMGQRIDEWPVSDSVKLGLKEFYRLIKLSCGLDALAGRAVIDAEADLCKFAEVKKETKDV